MMTKEITRRSWETFCQRVNESLRGALISIQVLTPEGVTEDVVTDLPLVNFRMDEESDPCNDNLVIEAGQLNERPHRHLVIEPIHLRLKNGQNDRYNRLQITAENGTTVVSFRPGITPALLDGLTS